MGSIRPAHLFFSLVAVAAIASAETDSAVSGQTDLGSVEVVDSQDKYRYRTNTPAPKLVYDRKFFERFEPTTAGEMLKRVPGAVFMG